MNKTAIILLLNFLTLQITGQSNSWIYLSDKNYDEQITDIIEEDQNNIFFVGYIKEELNSYYSYGSIYKLDYFGSVIDSNYITNTDSSVIIRAILYDTTTNTSILNVITQSKTEEHNHCAFHLRKIDSDLNTVYKSKSYLFPSNYHDIQTYATFGLNNNIITFGYIFTGVYTPRMFIYETNYLFDSIKAKVFINDGAILPMKLKQLNNFNYWIIGELHPKYLLIDTLLNIISDGEWRIPHEMNGSYGIKWDTDTSFYLAGDAAYDSAQNHSSPHDIGFIHQFHPLDTTGYIYNNWGAIDTNDYPAFWGALDYKNKDSIFIGGTKNINLPNLNFSPTPSWYVLLQTDSMLNIRWERFYGGDAYYNMTKLIATNDGGCIMAGTRFDYLEHPNIHERDIFILKVDAEGLIVSAEGKPSELMHEALVFPNPGSSYLRVRVAAQYKQSTFMLYDISGKQVLSQQITDKWAEVNTTFLKTGTYIYKIYNNEGLFERGKWVKR